MRYLLILLLGTLIFSCKKYTEETSLIYSEASYKVTIIMNWKSPEFVVPAGAHFTTLTGMIHSKDTFLWNENILATRGLEDVAEVGNNSKMNSEMDIVIEKYKALSRFQINAPGITGMAETTMKFSTAFPCISFASMIAPSPDWFIGVSNVNLLENNKWVTDKTVVVKLYDAGTEDGDVFGYNNPATNPLQPVKLLTLQNATVLSNNNNNIFPAMATIRFQKN